MDIHLLSITQRCQEIIALFKIASCGLERWVGGVKTAYCASIRIGVWVL